MKNSKALIELSENKIIEHLNKGVYSDTIQKSSIYSINAGGKRFRPLLLFKTLKALGVDPELGVIPAASLEMIHTYSLIHDDLPAMDDDELRRGQPTNHIVFGEAVAILAGDNLLTESFSLLTKSPLTQKQIVDLVSLFAKSSGQNGMIGGQMLDIEATNREISVSDLERIHHTKTGKLIVAAIKAAGIIANINRSLSERLVSFGEKLGLLFQVTDDILDVTGTTEEIGKVVGSDEKNNKTTYVTLYGLEKAREIEQALVSEMETILDSIRTEVNVTELEEVLSLIQNRTK